MPDTMTALLLDRPAGSDELSAAMRLGRLPVPEPGPGQVRMRVTACGLNPVDWKVACGGSAAWGWPHIFGLDVAGVVDALDSASATANLGALAFNGAPAFIGGRPDLSAVPGFTISPSIREASLGAAYSAGTARDCADLAAMLAEMLELVAAGRLDTRVAEAVPLDAVPAAYVRLAQGHQAGKLVCYVAGSAGA